MNEHAGGAAAPRVDAAAAPSVPEQTIGLLDILQLLLDHRRLLIVGPLLVGLAVLGLSYLMTPVYTGVAKILPPQQQQSMALSMLQSLGAFGGLAGAAAGLKNPADQYVAFFKTNAVEDALIARFKLQERYQTKYRRDTRDTLRDNSNIAVDKDNIIVIEFDDEDPRIAAAIANAYVEELGKLLDRLAVTEAQQRRLFFEKQLGQTKTALVAAEQALAASGVSVAAINAHPSAALEAPVRLRAEVAAQEVKLASMRNYLTESASEYRQAQAELEALQAQLAKAQAHSETDDRNNDYIAKYRDYKYYETLFEIFSKQYEMARVDESREGAVIQVIDAAEVPELKSKPKRGFLAVFATLLSGFMLLIYVIGRNQLDDKIRSDAQFAARLAALRGRGWRGGNRWR